MGPEVLLARRALGKYHSAGLWANSCCSHPRAGEKLLYAAYRRVHEELGCDAQGLREVGFFVYRAAFANGITEHEYDHVLVGRCVVILSSMLMRLRVCVGLGSTTWRWSSPSILRVSAFGHPWSSRWPWPTCRKEPVEMSLAQLDVTLCGHASLPLICQYAKIKEIARLPAASYG